jgi:hypothetical protein
MPYRSADGRTFPTTSRGRRTALFFTNDHGVYVIDSSAGSAGKMREAGTPAERDQALDLYRRHRQTLQNRRFEISRRAPPLCGHNLWDSNMPGSTLFMPVCDVSFSLIGLIAQFVDARLERFAATAGRGMHIVDDRFDFRHLMWFMQAHHLDTDYYDRFFRPGAYGTTHAAHMATWHS